VDARGSLSGSAVGAGLRYFFKPSLRGQLEREIRAQLERFRATGLRLDHVNGHLNMHLHPVIFRILLREAERHGIRAIRLTRDPFFFNARLAAGRWGYRASHAIIYQLLSRWAEGALRRRRICFTRRVFGLLQSGLVERRYVLRLVERLPEGDSEFYSHPSVDQFKPELEALLAPEVRCALRAHGVELVRYQDLSEL
jgi:chitin disaccharide deacetylase